MHASRRKALGISGSGYIGKVPVVGMIERGGRVRTEVMDEPNRANIEALLLRNIDTKRSTLMTDEAGVYRFIAAHLASRGHPAPVGVCPGRDSQEQHRGLLGDRERGLYGVYHHVDRGYLGC